MLAGFLTAVLQCHARKHHLALSNLQFKHIVQAELPKTDNMPLEKVFVYKETFQTDTKWMVSL